MSTWDRIKQHLAQTVSAESYKNWLAPTEQREEFDGTLVVRVPNEASKVWMEQEYAERRVRAQDEVVALEERRAQLGDVITQLEARLAGYREDLTRTSEELARIAADPDRLGARPTLSIPPDEVLEAGAGVVAVDEVVVVESEGEGATGDWAPGSWSQVADGLPGDAESSDADAADDAAMEAFFEGEDGDDNRRFGWRR